LTFVQPSTDK